MKDEGKEPPQNTALTAMKEDDLSEMLKRYQHLKRQNVEYESLMLAFVEAFLEDRIETPDEETKLKLLELRKGREEIESLKKRLSWLLRPGNATVISDPALHRIAYELLKETNEENVDDDGAVDDWYYGVMDALYIDPNQAARNLASIKPLFLLYRPSANLGSLVQEAVTAFCLDMHTATVAIARTLVETAVVDIAVKIGRVSDPAKIKTMRMCERISSLIDRSVTKGSPLRQQIDSFMESASEIVHGNQSAGADAAHKHLEQAFSLIKELYGYYQSQYPRGNHEG